MTLPIVTNEPVLMVKVEFAPNAMPLPVKVQLPDVVADPKLNPESDCDVLNAIVFVTALASPRNTAESPAVQAPRFVPSAVQNRSDQLPLPDWKPAVVDVSHVTVAATAGRRLSRAAESRSAEPRSGVFRIGFRPTLLGRLLPWERAFS
jgi:hypothetical protein